MEKLVSIIVPVYNLAQEGLERCLNSIISQTYSQIEILVVNDGSRDNSQEIIEKVACHDARIHKLVQKNRGVAAARNYALSHANGDYYLFIDGDDYISADFVEDLLMCAEKNHSELVICGYTIVDSKNKSYKEVIPSNYTRNLQEEWAYRISAVWCRLYSREFWISNNLHFVTEKGARAEDVPIALFSNLMAKNISVVYKAGYYYVQRENSAMHQKGKMKFLFPYKAFNDMFDSIEQERVINSKIFFDIGVLKFLSQFQYDIYKNANLKEKRKFREYVCKLLKRDFKEMVKEWHNIRNQIDFPLVCKLAITLFCIQYRIYLARGN